MDQFEFVLINWSAKAVSINIRKGNIIFYTISTNKNYVIDKKNMVYKLGTNSGFKINLSPIRIQFFLIFLQKWLRKQFFNMLFH